MVGDSSDDSAAVPTSTSPDVAAGGGTFGDGALDLGYTVTVDSFSGPLDLLLYLVRRTELDILEVPLSLIVDQFVETVRSWQDADLDIAGEFILMAATLLEYKARTIVPPLDQPEEGAEDEPMFDPRESLLRSLLAYRRFKEAGQGLGELEELRRPLLERQYRENVPEAPPEDSDIDLGEIDLSLLATTCERVLSRIGGLGPRTVIADEMPLGVRIATMLDELAVRERTTLSALLAGNHSRVVHITTVMATLELTRQRFIEVEQPEQFGEIALRLRSTEEREREPELPPPEPDGPKRRRKLPLVTFTAPQSTESVTSDDDTVEATPEEPAENDEQRFLRELEEATRVTAVLAITANVEKSFTEHWYTLHPELKPVAPPPVPVPPVLSMAEPVVKRFPPRRSAAPATVPSSEAPTVAAVAVEPPATITESAVVVPATDVVVAAPASAEVAETPVIAESPVVASPVVVATEPAVDVPATVAVESPASESPVAVVPAQHVLPVEQWPVLHALPAAKEVPHPLDTITSDDPAAVNALLSGEVSRAARNTEDDDEDEKEDEEEEIDPDELLADDPALVNAALLADTPRMPVERKPVHDIIIPPATETSVWTAPVDHGLTVAEVEDDVVSPAVAPMSLEEKQFEEKPFEEKPLAENPPPTQSTPSAEVSVTAAESPVAEQATVEPVIAASPVPPPMAVEFAPTRAPLSEPTPTTAPLILPEAAVVSVVTPPLPPSDDDLEPDDQDDVAEGMNANDPALVDAALQADSPRASINLHPVHDLTIPTATETSVWTAPVDRGQTAAEVDDEPESLAEVAAEVTADDALDVAATDVVEVMAARAPVTLPRADVIAAVTAPLRVSAPSISEPTPTTAPLVLPERAVEAVTMRAAVEIVTSAPAKTPAAVVDDHAVAEDPPPPEDGPPPTAPPLPPPRPDSPLSAPTTTPIQKRQMSPPPRSKAWLLIAIFIAINAAWAGGMWLTNLPREVLEVAATEQGGNVEQPTLVWRFNLDVVDALAQAKPPELVPVISPALSGRWVWSDARTLVFEAAGPLPLATTFTAILPNEDFRTVHGFRLRAPGTQTWSTPALAISGAAVETFDREGTTIALTFNQPVDPLAIAQHLSVEIVPAEESVVKVSTPDVSTPDVSTPVPAVAVSAPVSDLPAIITDSPIVNDQQLRAPVVSAEQPVVISQTPRPAETPVVKPALVRAISTTSATTIRLLVAAPVRGRATLRLPAGTVGVAGSLGLVAGWEQQIALQQTLHLTTGEVVVPSHGDVRVDVAVSDPAAPRELLAPVVSVDPPVPVTVSTTATGVSLVGAFVPGQSYRIAIASTWPNEPSTSGHMLTAYTAASAVSIIIPERPAGIWPLENNVIDGSQRLAALAVPRADVMLLTVSDDECVASREITWTSPSDAMALLDLDDLTQDQPAAQYRLRVTSGGETPVISDQTLVIENVYVRPQALFAAFSEWAIAALAGNEDADVPVRVVRIAH